MKLVAAQVASYLLVARALMRANSKSARNSHSRAAYMLTIEPDWGTQARSSPPTVAWVPWDVSGRKGDRAVYRSDLYTTFDEAPPGTPRGAATENGDR